MTQIVEAKLDRKDWQLIFKYFMKGMLQAKDEFDDVHYLLTLGACLEKYNRGITICQQTQNGA